jgi:proteasome alpha subunit
MSSAYYVSPEQLMRDKAEFAQKGISRGRATITMRTEEGVLFVAHNPGAALTKVSEVYDRIGFAGAGRYSEFEALRKAGIRHADVTGYSYSREDVSAKGLADGYSQMLGNAFAHEMKPLEVELVVAQVAQVGEGAERDEIYRISFDGSIAGEGQYTVVGGEAEQVLEALHLSCKEIADLSASMAVCKKAIEGATNGFLTATDFEVGLLDRRKTGRTFSRLTPEFVGELLGG